MNFAKCFFIFLLYGAASLVQAAVVSEVKDTFLISVGSNHSYEPRLSSLHYAAKDAAKFAKVESTDQQRSKGRWLCGLGT